MAIRRSVRTPARSWWTIDHMLDKYRYICTERCTGMQSNDLNICLERRDLDYEEPEESKKIPKPKPYRIRPEPSCLTTPWSLSTIEQPAVDILFDYYSLYYDFYEKMEFMGFFLCTKSVYLKTMKVAPHFFRIFGTKFRVIRLENRLWQNVKFREAHEERQRWHMTDEQRERWQQLTVKRVPLYINFKILNSDIVESKSIV